MISFQSVEFASQEKASVKLVPVLLVLGLTVLAFSSYRVIALTTQANSLRASIAIVKIQREDFDGSLSFQDTNQARQVRSDWPALFAALESAHHRDIRLTRLQSVRRTKQVKIEAYANSLSDAIAHLNRLRGTSLTAVYMQSHERIAGKSQPSMKFVIQASWAASDTPVSKSVELTASSR